MDYTDIRNGLVAAIAVNVEEPIFESQTKTKLGSTNMVPGGVTVNKYVGDFIKQEVDNFLHKNADIAEAIQQKIQESEKERKAIAGVTKLARERAKKANLHNRKLRDCRIHLNDPKGKGLEEDSCIFITEGDSASGSITKSRDVNTQAVFSLRGKPLNSFGLTKKVVYENEEFNLLQAALNIEDGIEGLRYNKVIVATDADVDGMHIRLLLITFFLQFFPDLIKKGHVYILQTPLFRVRNKKKTNYCYSEEVIGIGINENKNTYFPIEKREEMIRELYKDEPRIQVMSYDCLTIDFAQEVEARFIVRGIRTVKDFEYEETIADINRKLAGIETILLFTEPELTCVSSTIVRELLTYNKDISQFIPKGMKMSE